MYLGTIVETVQGDLGIGSALVEQGQTLLRQLGCVYAHLRRASTGVVAIWTLWQMVNHSRVFHSCQTRRVDGFPNKLPAVWCRLYSRRRLCNCVRLVPQKTPTYQAHLVSPLKASACSQALPNCPWLGSRIPTATMREFRSAFCEGLLT